MMMMMMMMMIMRDDGIVFEDYFNQLFNAYSF